jgi:hypothetical protein
LPTPARPAMTVPLWLSGENITDEGGDYRDA